jgi:hypothetical protein
VVRSGQDPGLVPAGGQGWEHELYERILAAVVDQRVEPGGDAPPGTVDDPDADYGFQTSLREPDQYGKGMEQDPLPPAGPRRARAPQLLVAPARLALGVTRPLVRRR